MKICYIVGAGDFDTVFTPSEDDLVIAADGGYDSLRKNGIRCDLIIGDMDSVKEVPRDIPIVRHKVKKDETDMHLSYLEGKKRGYSEFRIYGATGGRSDHTFANYCLLLYMKNNGDNGVICTAKDATRVVKNEEITLSGRAGAYVSVFAFGEDAEGVTIKGLEYETNEVTLKQSFPLGVSNSFIGKEARVTVKSGAVLIISQI